MAAIRVGGTVSPLNAQIYLAPYDPSWPAQYAGEEAKIRAALGDKALLLEHAGSTSIPGLAAKPIIDILLALADSGDEGAYVPALTAQGYRLHLREPDWEQHRVMKGDAPLVNLHVFTIGSPEITRMLAFRDRCRTHPEELTLYAETKRALPVRSGATCSTTRTPRKRSSRRSSPEPWRSVATSEASAPPRLLGDDDAAKRHRAAQRLQPGQRLAEHVVGQQGGGDRLHQHGHRGGRGRQPAQRPGDRALSEHMRQAEAYRRRPAERVAGRIGSRSTSAVTSSSGAPTRHDHSITLSVERVIRALRTAMK